MIREPASTSIRPLKTKSLTSDFVVVGGGIPGTCAALSAAREGLKVVLIQDRPVLGGNGSSEVRLWWLGATCHGMTNNRWAREAGIVNDLLLKNLHQNPEGNPLLVDLLLLEAVHNEPNITLLLNTAADGVEKSDPDTLRAVTAFCPQNSTRYTVTSPLFCDASGDGILGFLSGAAFRMGAETRDEFDEALAPDQDFGELLGDSIYFYTKDAGHPVPFHAPSYAQDINPDEIRMMKYFNLKQQGCQLWWIEAGGRRDTVHETETIKWDLWKIVYGIWDHIKNSGNFPDSENLTLDWVGQIPGKRESRRFEGDTMLTQHDVVHATPQPDTVGFGGWAIDLHPADGAFSKLPSAIQYQSRSLYPIPYRCLYSRNITNLFLGGRTMSASHIAFGSTRVMCTLGQLGEVIGLAAAQCTSHQQSPATIDIPTLQTHLLRRGFHLPQTRITDTEDLAQTADISASSFWQPSELPPADVWVSLDKAQAQMIPLQAGDLPAVTLDFKAASASSVTVEWSCADKAESQTPSQNLGQADVQLPAGESTQSLNFKGKLPQSGYAFLIVHAAPGVELRLSEQRATGLIRLVNKGEQRKGDSHGDHIPAEEAGCEAFQFWQPERRPNGQNFALKLDRPLQGFEPQQVQGHVLRPNEQPNAWVADPDDSSPELTLSWTQAVTVQEVRIFVDPDWDHPLESVILQHPERIPPCMAKHLVLLDADGNILAEITDNLQTLIKITLPQPITTTALRLQIRSMQGPWPAALFGCRVYG